MKKLFDNSVTGLGALMTAFSLIGIIARATKAGLRGIFADILSWYHAIADAVFHIFLAWPVTLIWSDFHAPRWVVDVVVGLYGLSLTSARVVASMTVARLSVSPAMPRYKRWLAYSTLGVFMYIATLLMTLTLLGPATCIHAIFKGAAIRAGFPKSWTAIFDNSVSGGAELREVYVGTFDAALVTAAAILFFFAINAYAPGLPAQ